MRKSTKCIIFILISIILGVTIFELSPIPFRADIGSFHSQAEGEKASIQRLSKEIRFRPWKSIFEIYWKCSGNEDCGSLDYRSTIYDRQKKIIGYEVDVGSGYTKSWECKNDGEIHAVSLKNGSLSDFRNIWNRE